MQRIHRRTFLIVFGILSSFPPTACPAADVVSSPTSFRVTVLGDLDRKDWKFAEPATQAEIERIRAAAPSEPIAKPSRPRKLLVYGRPETHAPVPRCFVSLEAMGRKTGGFETVWTGDETVFLPENLRQFDAIVMNNTHEHFPFMPRGFKTLDEAAMAKAREREAACEKSFSEFIRGGKGLVGIHAANVWVKWPEYREMIGAMLDEYLLNGKGYWVRGVEPRHPLCSVTPEVFEIADEVYGFALSTPEKPATWRNQVRVLMELDRERVMDKGQLKSKSGKDFDYAISWVKRHGEGRVFYCSLGHWPDAYVNPYVLRHWLAGIQFAIGDLEAPAEPTAKE